jgi:hypothetical protein
VRRSPGPRGDRLVQCVVSAKDGDPNLSQALNHVPVQRKDYQLHSKGYET